MTSGIELACRTVGARAVSLTLGPHVLVNLQGLHMVRRQRVGHRERVLYNYDWRCVATFLNSPACPKVNDAVHDNPPASGSSENVKDFNSN